MSQKNSYRATIYPIIETPSRPLWSVMIPTYNCAHYLRETLAGVLAQDPGSDLMQIEVIDDCSTKDDPKAVVEELGRGRVRFYQQPQNVGYIKNFETCLQRSRGHLIHLLHGDDCVLPGFYAQLQRLFEQHPEIGAAFCRHILMDEQSHWNTLSPVEQLETGILKAGLEGIVANKAFNPIQTPSIAVRREVYERLGGFDQRFECCCEDWEMWVRIAAQYPIGYEVKPLAAYRYARQGSLTRTSLRSGKFARDMQKAVDIVSSYLPDLLPTDVSSDLIVRSREACALGILYIVRSLLNVGDPQSAFNQFQIARQLSTSEEVTKQLLQLLFRAGAMRLKHQIRQSTKSGSSAITRASETENAKS
ncbi:glycosyltransferase family 2 protein [Phormidesmis priestleyi]|uniref:glycosyltransferase family 2 protein n=1 Tax=Phormidesmis priestleyi TaxID=268141 RepID=UPI0009EF1570|nr:glycosyltransferase [Phormidesmis priestleyi]